MSPMPEQPISPLDDRYRPLVTALGDHLSEAGLNRARVLPQEGEIYEIYLRPEYQGIGLGRQLFGEAKLLLKSLGCKGLIVWGLEDSDHAYRFFRSSGGRDIAEGMENFGEKDLKKVGFVWP